ncbi:hypothetical protein BST25_03570 [Mycobacterium heidelbergense]|uniref:Secreted protein n=1 Tax=Mycobacterium heidelbergense TaxID=53376 RepID=A0A1X0DUH7_MYCHE|nr:hypothetical protein BST25_03570 [Mycobacterium heidelbergense]
MTQRRHVMRKVLVSAAIAAGFCAGGAASASADPDDTEPDPFGTLSCGCQEAAPAGSPGLRDEIDRGIREGHSAWLPGLPPPGSTD